VVVGAVDQTIGSTPDEFDIVLGWADEIRKGSKGVRGLKVRANADNGPDATRAREFGAEGIGLCRTEHMFLGEDRLPIVRRMILAETPEQETAALEELRVAQKADFVEILEARDGLPVTVRLLDPPLREFLPSAEDAGVEEAIAQATAGVAGQKPIDVIIGTMVETPRAAVRADEIAEVADFFSFGTNDLTQMTFGFSRDDVEGRMMSAYLEQGLLK